MRLLENDGDGLSDVAADNRTHTDPHADLTYGAMAEEHAGWLNHSGATITIQR